MKSFHFVFEDIRDECIEASLAAYAPEIANAAKWRPSVPLLVICGFWGAFITLWFHSPSAKLAAFLVPIAFALLLTVSSEQSRVSDARLRYEKVLNKYYDEKKCHFHDFSIDDTGFVEKCPCGTDARIWDAAKVWIETERMIVIQTHNNQKYMIAKRVIPPEQLQPVRDLISRHVDQT